MKPVYSPSGRRFRTSQYRRTDMRALVAILATVSVAVSGQQPRVDAPARGIRLEHYSWIEAAKSLAPDAVVVIPLGAALKEHGPHLKLRNDLTMAEYFADRVAAASAVVVTPP